MIVIVEVSGGAVTSVRADDDDLQVILVDHDNIPDHDGDEVEEAYWIPADEFTKADEQLLARLSERV